MDNHLWVNIWIDLMQGIINLIKTIEAFLFFFSKWNGFAVDALFLLFKEIVSSLGDTNRESEHGHIEQWSEDIHNTKYDQAGSNWEAATAIGELGSKMDGLFLSVSSHF